MDRDAAYFEQLTAERVRTRYVKGHAKREWVKPDSRRNEALDCRVYAYAALHGLMSMGLSLNRRADALPVRPQKPTARSSSYSQPMQPTKRRRMAVSSNYI